MDGIKVGFGALDELSSSIGAQVNQIEGNLNDLQGQISELQEIWQGSAGEGFQAVKTKWFDSAQSLRAVLKKIEIAVMQSNDGYRETESRNAGRWQ